MRLIIMEDSVASKCVIFNLVHLKKYTNTLEWAPSRAKAICKRGSLHYQSLSNRAIARNIDPCTIEELGGSQVSPADPTLDTRIMLLRNSGQNSNSWSGDLPNRPIA